MSHIEMSESKWFWGINNFVDFSLKACSGAMCIWVSSINFYINDFLAKLIILDFEIIFFIRTLYFMFSPIIHFWSYPCFERVTYLFSYHTILRTWFFASPYKLLTVANNSYYFWANYKFSIFYYEKIIRFSPWKSG